MMNQDKSWRVTEAAVFVWDDAEHDPADSEPSLGSLDGVGNQAIAWALGGNDAEDDPAEDGIADQDALYEVYVGVV
jgi:hypothetical protein